MGRWYNGRTCRLVCMLAMTTTYFLVELTVGYITNSVALIADSFHMMSDIIAIIIGLASLRISKWHSRKNTFGWVRAEILGALVNSVFLLALCFSILAEALRRFFMVEEITDPILLLTVGAGGLLVNVVGLLLFHQHPGHSHRDSKSDTDIAAHSRTEDIKVADHKHKGLERTITIEYEIDASASAKAKTREQTGQQMNMKGIFLHLMGDALGSVVVIISSLIIWLGEGRWRFYLDPLMSLILVFVILAATVPLLKETSLILLQTAPENLDREKLLVQLNKVEGVMGVHELHVWQLTGRRVVLSAHILCNNWMEYMRVAAIVKDLLHKAGIHSTTIQPEFVEMSVTKEDLQNCQLQCDEECLPDTCCGTMTEKPAAARDQNRKPAPVVYGMDADDEGLTPASQSGQELMTSKSAKSVDKVLDSPGKASIN